MAQIRYQEAQRERRKRTPTQPDGFRQQQPIRFLAGRELAEAGSPRRKRGELGRADAEGEGAKQDD